MSVAADYRLVSANLERNLEITANTGSVKLESEYYRDNRSKISSIDDFVNDTRLFRYAMDAFGLGDLAFAKGYMRKILQEGITDPGALANRTSDVRVQEFARTFDFDTFGDLVMKRPATGEAIVDRYVRQQLEVEAGARDGEGVRLALYFQRKAPEIDSALDILGDKALSQVVRTALGLPEAVAGVDIDRQVEILDERLDYESFKDPDELQRFLTRFTSLWDARSGASSDPVLALFGSGAGGRPSVSIELAMSLNTLKLGGR